MDEVAGDILIKILKVVDMKMELIWEVIF